jgi:hypothetical protein
MEHSVHLAAGKVVEGVSLTSHAKLVTKLRNAIKHTRNEDDETDLDKLNLKLANMDLNQGDTDDSDDEEEIDAGDAVGKALALVKQVCCCTTDPSLYAD